MQNERGRFARRESYWRTDLWDILSARLAPTSSLLPSQVRERMEREFQLKVKAAEKRSEPEVQRKMLDARTARKVRKSGGKGSELYDSAKTSLDFDTDAPLSKKAKQKKATKAGDVDEKANKNGESVRKGKRKVDEADEASEAGEGSDEEVEVCAEELADEEEVVETDRTLIPVVTRDEIVIVTRAREEEAPKGKTRVTFCPNCGSFLHKPSDCSWN